MRFIKRLIYILALFTPRLVTAQEDCRCIEISLKSVQKETGSVTFHVKNTCMRRIWFSTKGFWVSMSDRTHTSTETKLQKLTNTDKHFVLFRWNDEKDMTFHNDNLKNNYDKTHFSYSNTTDPQPKSLFGTRTYLCELDIK
ncbi:hypothetical protein [Polluticoccus soli]|uniref:hypothetical protein n=1 Tax=Polluticoccus soli TaxID=3034150 RepID=UPI0023E16F8C|nr:hypothetical protein [Flavipsychrobacter sp. JY13-12]